MISGHETGCVYRRYDIVAGRDLAEAAARMERYPESLNRDRAGALSGTPEGEERPSCPDRSGRFLAGIIQALFASACFLRRWVCFNPGFAYPVFRDPRHALEIVGDEGPRRHPLARVKRLAVRPDQRKSSPVQA
jgi:hypothetical protein